MTMTLNHVLIPARDKHASARFLAEVLGLNVGTKSPGSPDGRFAVVRDVARLSPWAHAAESYFVSGRPRGPRRYDREDAGDQPTIIDPRLAQLVLWQMRLQRRPRLIRQPKQIGHDALRQ